MMDAGGLTTAADGVYAVLARYLPRVGVVVGDEVAAAYTLDAQQVALLIATVEQERAAERAELERLERQIIPLLNSVRARLGKPPVYVPKPEADRLT